MRKHLRFFYGFLSSPHIIILLILITGALLRFYICFGANLPHFSADSYTYLAAAEAWKEGKCCGEKPAGYTFIVYLLNFFANSSQQENLLLGFNLILGIGIISLTYKIATHVFSSLWVGCAAACIIAFYPNQLNYTRFILSEYWAAFLLLFAYYIYFKDKKLLAGMLFFLAVWTRTPFLPLVICITGWEYFQTKKIPSYFVAGFVLPFCFFSALCYVQIGQFTLNTNNATNIAMAAQTMGAEMNDVSPPQVKSTGEALKIYAHSFTANPLHFFRQRAAALWELWGFPGDNPYHTEVKRSFSARLVIGCENLLLLVFGMFGMYKSRKNRQAFYLSFPFWVTTFVCMFLFAEPRYTFVVEPFLGMYAAYFFIDIYTTASFFSGKINSPAKK